MPIRFSIPLLALAILVAFASSMQPPPGVVAGPNEESSGSLPEEVRAQREELLRLRRELVGRRIMREARSQLPRLKLADVMRQYKIRPDIDLEGKSDDEIFGMLRDLREESRVALVYDHPNAEMKDICEEVPGNAPDEEPILSCVDDATIIEKSRSVAAIVHKDYIEPSGEDWVLKMRPLEMVDTASVDLCESEPIRNSPSTLVVGTAFLVEEDVVATAGHVVYGEDFLESHYFVFGYVMKSDGQPKTVYGKDDVYQGAEVMALRTGDSDYALIRLDRSATGRGTLAYKKSGKIPSSAKVYMLGHPEGMPQKYVGEAAISWNGSCAYFLSPLDARPSNSGSPVFNADTHEVEGILVRDEPTYVTICQCVITNIHSEAYGYEGANVVRTTQFAGLLEHPASVLVRSKLPEGSCAFIEVGNSVFAFDAGSQTEQLLPQDELGIYLLVDMDTDCWLRYQPEGGSVWDIVLAETSGHPLLKEACFR